MKHLIFFPLMMVCLSACKSKFSMPQPKPGTPSVPGVSPEQQSLLDKFKKQQTDIATLKAAVSEELGSSVEIAKTGSNGAGEIYIIFKNPSNGEFLAYNLNKWDGSTFSNDGDDIVRGMEKREELVSAGRFEDVYQNMYVTSSETVTEMVMVPQFNQFDVQCSCYRTIEVGEMRTYTKDTSGFKDVYIGQRYVDESNYQSFYYGGGFRFENVSSPSKDLESYASFREELSEKSIATKLKTTYSLSSDRAQELASLSMKYLRLENNRALTKSEKDTFAMKSLGVSMNQVENALKSKSMGYEKEYENLLRKAAEVNKTTPETIGKIFNEIME